MKYAGENAIVRGIFHVVSRYPKHFLLYRWNLDYFLESVELLHAVREADLYEMTPELGTHIFFATTRVTASCCYN